MATLQPWHERLDECNVDENGHEYVSADPGFERSMRGLFAGGCYERSGKTYEFFAGGYSEYNDFRETLCRAVHVVGPRTIWEEPDAWADTPFFELINFADNEGHIGPISAADLAEDFNTHRDQITARLSDDFRQYYEHWATALQLAAGTGIVTLH
ncbi:hypothetical protein [Nocardia sp. NPDC056000]|uniref:hypothetical protein n=1 Tax=Nocardia sp. NPDC056000 TaxID=3345674 RepID=UPI0035D5FF52